jgi:hypothetical protein
LLQCFFFSFGILLHRKSLQFWDSIALLTYQVCMYVTSGLHIYIGAHFSQVRNKYAWTKLNIFSALIFSSWLEICNGLMMSGGLCPSMRHLPHRKREWDHHLIPYSLCGIVLLFLLTLNRHLTKTVPIQKLYQPSQMCPKVKNFQRIFKILNIKSFKKNKNKNKKDLIQKWKIPNIESLFF